MSRNLVFQVVPSQRPEWFVDSVSRSWSHLFSAIPNWQDGEATQLDPMSWRAETELVRPQESGRESS